MYMLLFTKSEFILSEIIAPTLVKAEHTTIYVGMECSQQNADAHMAMLTSNMDGLQCVQYSICEWVLTHNGCDEHRRNKRQTADAGVVTFKFELALLESRLPRDDASSKISGMIA